MSDVQIERWVVIAAFAALAFIVSTEAYALSKSYYGRTDREDYRPAPSVLNVLSERAR